MRVCYGPFSIGQELIPVVVEHLLNIDRFKLCTEGIVDKKAPALFMVREVSANIHHNA